MKRIVVIILSITLLLVSIIPVNAATSNNETIMENNDESLNIVVYNYGTKTETTETIYKQALIDNVSQRASSMNITMGEISSAYIPEGVQVDDAGSISTYGLVDNDRVQTVVDPDQYPYRAVLALLLGWDTNDADDEINYFNTGTGFLEGYDVMATCAHNFWKADLGWVDDCRIYVRQDSGTYSETDYHHPKQWVCASAYTSDLNANYDWCAVTLWDDLGSSNGWFGKGWNGGQINNRSVTVSGYPYDAATVPEYKWGHQYKDYGTTTDSTDYIIRYDIDTHKGQSGSPVYDSNYIVWAIHTRAYNSELNEGNRITEWLYTILQDKYLEGAEIYGD